jgi:hypothetical protein
MSFSLSFRVQVVGSRPRRCTVSFLRLCDNDPLISTLKDVFDCQPIGVPDERIVPMTVIASDGSKSHFRGALADLLIGTPTLDVPVSMSDMANLKIKRSNGVKIDLGLKILDGFLSGFRLPSAGIRAKFEGALAVSFAFKEVRRQYVDVNVLGRKLALHKLHIGNPAAAIFGTGGFDFLVLDSVIQSRDFEMTVEKATSADFSVDIPVIQAIVQTTNVGMSVTSSTKLGISFNGPKHLTFAFACVRLFVDASGAITAMPPADKVPALKGYLASSRNMVVHYTPDRVLLSPDPSLLSFDP